jgi:hypothetical protein
MSRLNILNKEGLLSKQDCKEPLIHGCQYVTFTTCLDLSEPIKVSAYGTSGEVSLSNYTSDIASFIDWWVYFVKKDLNGFSGHSATKFILTDFVVTTK